ncbi:hypothetical protein PGTUg99_015492 [Puccinia graminis f. sp. tritici]|uniref:HAT C-terminal dimerisation domain-containing protein n=1 Tax=Puccinia graminis f. sp. tritici TaxID=56615 RepID=A0A5B0LVF8_PUCGR|nr:hypothetical protein PGTUg99_015492 [Puccinia graminis f. sp. tritici]
MIPWRHLGHLLARPIATLLKKKHLYKKMLAQTTDSGSNNNTMASSMYKLINDNKQETDSTAWDPTTMHVRCFCHKLALIVNAGLAALSLKTLPPDKTKQSVLGFFPVLGKLTKEPEPEEADQQAEIEIIGTEKTSESHQPEAYEGDADSESDYGNADEDSSATGSEGDASEVDRPTNTNSKNVKSTQLQELTQKLDVVIKQITRSAAQRAHFEKTAKDLKIQVAPLIAGYGIRWNVKYQSYAKAVKAREVIDHILKEDQEQNQAGIFEDVLFSPRDWKEIDNLNAELEVFVKLTSEMEGDSATGTHVIPKYLELKESLQEKISNAAVSDSLYPMYQAMRQRVNKYLAEAMQCETLVLATMMHPCFRMHVFELVFGAGSAEVSNSLELLNREFSRTKSQQKELLKNPDVAIIEKPTNQSAASQSLMSRLASRITAIPAAQENEVEAYLKADITFKDGAIDHKTTPLLWWKANCKTYPTLAVIARAYLGTPASSCSVERLFSAAADVCNSSRGSFLPSTMAHSVSSLMWLREEVTLSGDFSDAGKALSVLVPEPKTKK